jgi:hypothetical protein
VLERPQPRQAISQTQKMTVAVVISIHVVIEKSIQYGNMTSSLLETVCVFWRGDTGGPPGRKDRFRPDGL